MMQQLTGGEAMVRAAMANGIDTVFGLPGAQIYPLFDALHRLGVRTVTTRHEQGAAYMALGYAKATGRPGAFAVVPGPGVLNTTAALCTAMGTCTPVLCLSGQIPSQFIGGGRGHLHELRDQTATLATLIKHAVRIDRPAETQRIMNAAFRTMLSGRPGPVAVEMCWDTMAQEWQVETGSGNDRIDQPEPDPEAIAQAAAMLAKAGNVMIMCGAGAQHAGAEVLRLAELLQAPVTAFRSGRGVVAEDHDLGVSSVAARELWEDTEVLLGIGSRLEMMYMRWADMNRYDRRPTRGPKVIRIDIDPAEMQRFQPDIGIVADAARGCALLIEKLEDRIKPAPDKPARIAAAKAKTRRAIEKVQPQLAYLDVIRQVLPRDGFFVPELSQAGFTSYFGFPVLTPRTYVSEGYQGTLGFGFPTALGVKAACPERAVVTINGDGGFLYAMPELATAVAHDIGVVALVFNNHSFANVRRDQQRAFSGRLIGSDLVNPDFVKLAESFGVAARRVQTPRELQPVLERALADGKPAVIEVVVEKDAEASPWEFIFMRDKPWH
jgi:acetolactate synthase-1/2/3 large subunit